jgi:hypothetical protein
VVISEQVREVSENEDGSCTRSLCTPRIDPNDEPQWEDFRKRVHEDPSRGDETELVGERLVDQVGKLAGEKAECEEPS